MLLEDYVEAQRSIVAALLEAVFLLFRSLLGPGLTRRQWQEALAVAYPQVEQARTQAGELAREFYDTQRADHVTGERHDFYRESYKPDWFEAAMEPARDALSTPEADETAVHKAGALAAREVENAGRRTILRGVDSDPKVQGWARVATGAETCAFCLMLVSRGPVYRSARGAGLRLKPATAVELWRQDDQDLLNEFMIRFHPHCDCKVVPVFSTKDWPGRSQAERAYELWHDITEGTSGKKALAAFRSAITSGRLDPARLAPSAVRAQAPERPAA